MLAQRTSFVYSSLARSLNTKPTVAAEQCVKPFCRRFHAARSYESAKNQIGNAATAKPPSRRPIRKFLFRATLASTAGALAYYQFALSPKEQRKVRVHFKSFYRAFRSFKEAVMIGIDYKWTLWGIDEEKQQEEYDEKIKGCHMRAALRLVDACIANGGMYVKLGQGLSTMNHILPKEYYMTLRKLQTEALPSTGVEIDQLFLEEFNKLPSEFFSEFDYTPIAAASLAHVHKAKLKNGEETAVKLQYIDLQDRFVGDIFTCKVLLRLLGWAFPSFEFSWVLDDLKEVLVNELDFEKEAANSKRCFNELKHLNYVYVPKVYDNLSTKRILTMEFIDGFRVSDVEGMKKAGIDIKDLDTKLVTLFAEQIFHTGFVHADPHHGNIFVRKTPKNSTEVVLIDHGLYDYINENDRRSLCKLWKAIILKDEENMKHFSTLLNVQEKHHLILAGFLYMRPLHRPLHPKFIFKKDWVKLSDDAKLALEKDGVNVIPYQSEFKNMSRQELNELRQKFKPFFEEIKESILEVFRSIPRSLMLVCRNLNTVRSIIVDHGSLVDRHTIMARVAIYGAYKDQLKLGWRMRIRAWFELRMFDMILFSDRFRKWVNETWMKAMIKFGYIKPELIEEITKSFNSNEDYH